MAERYGIDYALISDDGLAISRQYVGVDDNDFAIPGLFILRPDGTVFLRSVGGKKDSRIYAAALIGHLDRLAGADSKALPRVRGGYDAPSRKQLRLGIGGGVTRGGGDTGGLGVAQLEALLPLGRHLMIGAGVTGELAGTDALGADGLLRLRRWTYAELGETYLQIPVGVRRAGGSTGFHSGAVLGTHFAWYPSLGIHLELGVDVTRLAGTTGAAARLSAGLAYLF